jgi:hypothetical protein
MKVQLAATAFCALLVAQPTWAQQDQTRSMSPSRAETNPTSNPPADPHKDGGRPESHGGTVHAPQIDSTSLPSEMRQSVERLARTAITAQQYGNLASKRHTSGAVHDLGDQMVLTNSRINRALTAIAPNLQNTQIPEQERGTFDNLARDGDEVQFGISIAQWVTQTYPQTISTLERLGQSPELSEMATSAIPDLRAQLSSAQQILQSASASPNGQPTSTGTVTDPKVESD